MIALDVQLRQRPAGTEVMMACRGIFVIVISVSKDGSISDRVCAQDHTGHSDEQIDLYPRFRRRDAAARSGAEVLKN
jgi:hypothetical protein